MLGNGSYGTQYQVSCNGIFMSGKVLHNELLPTGEKLQKIIEQFKSDCYVAVQMCIHINIVQYFGICCKAPYKFPMILHEYAEENLISFLEQTKSTLTFTQKLNLGHEMANGLAYLHMNQIVHKNLHPSNILIKYGHVKISDFITPQLDEVQFSSKDNSIYTAPEVIKNNKYFSYQSDIFSLGVLKLQLFTKTVLTVEGLQEVVQDIKYKPLKRLICSCISDNITDRPNANGICQQIVAIRNNPTAVAYEALNSKVSFICKLWGCHTYMHVL